MLKAIWYAESGVWRISVELGDIPTKLGKSILSIITINTILVCNTETCSYSLWLKIHKPHGFKEEGRIGIKGSRLAH